MQVNRCVSCMEETESYPCPHCGFDADAQPQPGYALPRNTILYGKYLVGKMLGQGGFGITYVGWDLALEIKVAIKEYYPTGLVVRQNSMSSKLQWNGAAQNEAARRTGIASFLKEARKMARVDRIRQVVRVRDTFCENDTAYIIMDFVKGETLKVRLEREGPLPFGQAMDIFRPALAALEEVHKAGLVHRDLSPDNIMLEPEGGVRILDLGAAKDLAINQGASSMLVTKGGFSPLEQYGQRGGSGPWTDVYAMAATIYYSLTGILPPNAIDRLDGDELCWDIPVLRDLPAPAREALQKALAVHAKDRTQSMEELLAGLERPGEPAQAWKEPLGPAAPPQPGQEAQAVPDVRRVPQAAFGEQSKWWIMKPGDRKSCFTALAAAAGAVILTIAWSMYYLNMPAPSWVGGILTAAGLWYALKLSSRLQGAMISFLSLLAGGVLGMVIFIIEDTARDLRPLPYYGVGALLGAIWVWIFLKKASRLPVRAIAVSSAVTGVMLAVSLKLVQMGDELLWWEPYHDDVIPDWEYLIGVYSPFVVAFALLILGIWFVLRTKQSNAETAGL